jgi:mannosyl-3-phosphoglycerate phosphatase
MNVVFTDLDGTLLDQRTYSYEPARPALELLERRKIPLVFCTSKTRAEVEVWRRRLQNAHPFIIENGGAAFVPRGYFSFSIPDSIQRDGYDVVEFGDHYASLVEALCAASSDSRAKILSFHEMTAGEISDHCGLPLEDAQLARQREYDEPFELLEPEREPELLREIEKRGKRWTRGGRFYHITGNNDKAKAVRLLTELYGRPDKTLVTVGLGDGLNDAEFLAVVDVPFLIRSAMSDELQRRVPHGRLTDRPGPEGWNRAILDVIS